MPLYEYKCHSCGKVFEVMQKFSDEPLQRHDECGGEVERLISRTAFQLKGSGWYVTDYARNTGGAKSADNGGASGDSGGKEAKATETKAESKPAPAAPTGETKP
jgi:putative FmdB family regulatory protein